MKDVAPLDLDTVRAALATTRGRDYWRSLEELAGQPGFDALLAREFPRLAAGLFEHVDRRSFLQLMGASLALAGLSACTRQPTERIMPYVKAPEDIIPGRPLFFATAMPVGGVGQGLLVESHMGRPTKVEGNPEHPTSLGKTDAIAQASILGMYDPDRSQVITSAGEIRPWKSFVEAVRHELEGQRASGGAGLRILTETVTSPTLAAQLRELLAAYPKARWHQWDLLAHDGARAGARIAFGVDADAQYRFDRADVIVALDADFLGSGPQQVRYVRDFASRRTPERAQRAAQEAVDRGLHGSVLDVAGAMSRLYVVESTPTNTGARADHRLPLTAADVEGFAWVLAAELGALPQKPTNLPPEHAEWARAVVADLAAHRGSSLVVAGDHQSATVHALAHALNVALDNVGTTVVYTAPVAAEPVHSLSSFRDLVNDIEGEKVDVLLILGGNPVATAPSDFRFAERLAKVAFRVHLGLYDDETALLCHWHVPEAHYLESWSDVRAADGTTSIVQPLIAPLYDGRTAHEVVAACAGKEATPYELVRAYWQKQQAGPGFERWWRKAVHDGVIADSALPAKTVALRPDWAEAAAAAHDARNEAAHGVELVFRLDPYLLDGRFANNGWLQELPRPLTKLTWDNVALISPASARRLGVVAGDVVVLKSAGRSVEAPVWVMPGQPEESVTVHLGYGRQRAGRVGTGVGFDANVIRTGDAPWIAHGLEIVKTGRRYPLATTQEHFTMDRRPLVLQGTVEEFRRTPHLVKELVEEPPHDLTLYPPHPYEGAAWGMTVDLATCVGCNACVAACNAENNIAVVGKDQVARGREMHWIRVDRYFEGDEANPAMLHQPVLCMQCENAPCEVVCPVNATVHSNEGLNDMVYNRCVGTKYCSNNCPYKVRRFNFFKYQDWTTESLKMARNPDVTVRSYGVMEKCTYCVQRISAARITARKEERPLRDGEVVTACAQACPADALVFGDINDPQSRVAALKKDPRNYGLLAELNTRPRTTYLASIRNPNPALTKES